MGTSWHIGTGANKQVRPGERRAQPGPPYLSRLVSGRASPLFYPCWIDRRSVPSTIQYPATCIRSQIRSSRQKSWPEHQATTLPKNITHQGRRSSVESWRHRDLNVRRKQEVGVEFEQEILVLFLDSALGLVKTTNHVLSSLASRHLGT